MNFFRLYVDPPIGFMPLISLMPFICLIIATCLLGCQPVSSHLPAEASASKARINAEFEKARQVEVSGGEVLNVGFVVLDAVYNAELMAPYDVIQHTIFRDDAHYMQPFIVAPSMEPVVSFEGIEIKPHFTFEDAPEIDVLVLPSTENSMSLDLENKVFMDWLEKVVKRADHVISVCDGAFPLAATGALNGRTATTFPGDRERFASMFPEIDVRFDKNFVVDGKFITSVGGALSYEPAFYLVEYLYSKANADKIAEGLVWNWDLEQVDHLIVERNQ